MVLAYIYQLTCCLTLECHELDVYGVPHTPVCCTFHNLFRAVGGIVVLLFALLQHHAAAFACCCKAYSLCPLLPGKPAAGVALLSCGLHRAKRDALTVFALLLASVDTVVLLCWRGEDTARSSMPVH